MASAWTIRSLITWTTQWLCRHGIASPRLDAELMLSHALHCQRLDLYLYPDKPVTEAERVVFRSFIKRRANREPVAYILGYKEFWGRTFEVDSRVLIPRPETETLIEVAITKLSKTDTCLIADLGTGSGCIGVTLASEFQGIRVIASDISGGALEVAKKNAAKSDVADRIIHCKGDWCDIFPTVTTPCSVELILSNPPYIPSADLHKLQPEILKFEPSIALEGGKNGITSYEKLIKDAGHWLTSGGWLIMEIGCRQAETVQRYLTDASFVSIECKQDGTGRDRVLCAMKP
jgi:release factor glutamine methyltransferase